jgi:hypothetical protein
MMPRFLQLRIELSLPFIWWILMPESKSELVFLGHLRDLYRRRQDMAGVFSIKSASNFRDVPPRVDKQTVSVTQTQH